MNGGSEETIKKHLLRGSEQANVIVMDIPAITSKWNIIKGVRRGWNENIKRIFLNWQGQWYQLKKEHVFSDYLEKIIK